MKKLLQDWHVEAIKKRIDEGLRLRCINVETSLVLIEREGDNKGHQHLVLTSTPFNTVPVLHSKITIEEFGADVRESAQKLNDGNEIPCVRFYVSVHARYEGNGASLFTVRGQMQTRENGATVLFFEEDSIDGRNNTVHESFGL